MVRRADHELLPLQQGDLVSLCGLYATINALRICADPYRPLKPHHRRSLMECLAASLDHQNKLARVFSDGLTTPELSALLREAASWLKFETGLKLERRKPFHRQRHAPLSAVVERIATHLKQSGTSAIIGVWGRLDHWTVVRRITPKAIELFDSQGLQRFRLSSLDTLSPAISGKSLQLAPTSVFLLQIQR